MVIREEEEKQAGRCMGEGDLQVKVRKRNESPKSKKQGLEDEGENLTLRKLFF